MIKEMKNRMMDEKGAVFQIDLQDNVATALVDLEAGENAVLIGEHKEAFVKAITKVPLGHKIALEHIQSGEEIIKYGVVIGRANAEILKGSWVHLHVMQSCYDERSSHLDIITGAPKDVKYE